MVSACPKRAADASPVKMVAIVEEYFFNTVSASGDDTVGLLREETDVTWSSLSSLAIVENSQYGRQRHYNDVK